MSKRSHRPIVRMALVGGPAYDPLYSLLPAIGDELGLDLKIVASAPHQELNGIVANAAAEGPLPFDLISTHIKYAPSQHRWLRPLDSLVDTSDLESFFPSTLEQCRFDGSLWQLPRNVDARLMHYRGDWLADESRQAVYATRFGRDLHYPQSWPELADIAEFFSSNSTWGFAFPGRSSGLFGTFFELLVMAGGELLDSSLRPAFVSDAGEWSLNFLKDLNGKACPPDLPAWHFDEVSEAFRAGSVAMVGDWPGYFSLHRDPTTSVAAKSLMVERYPVGPAGVRKVYSGSHSFAIAKECRDVGAVLAVLRALTSYQAQLLEARLGVFPARQDVFLTIRRESASDQLATHRLNLLEATVQDDLLTFPKLPEYPALEDAVWPILQAGIVGTISVRDALERAAQETITVIRKH